MTNGRRTPPVPFDTSVAAIVVKLRHSVIHYGGLGAIRSLGRLGIPVYAVHEGRLAPPATSRYLSGGFVWEPGGDPEFLFEGLTAFVERLGSPAVLVPTDDAAAVFIAEHATELADRFLFLWPPPALPRTLASKQQLYQLCDRLGVPCPRVMAPTSRDEVEAFLEDAVFPVVVKGAEPWLLPVGAGVPSTSIVRTPEGLLDLYRRVEGHQATGLLFQEYIPPGAGQDWFVHGYCDDASTCLVGFTGRKLRSYPAHAGPTSLGSWEPNEELLRQAQELFQAIAYRGIMDLDYRLDLRDGRYKLLDFNPRLGAQFRLFEDDMGIDVVRAMHLDLTGRAVPAGRPLAGRRFVVENHDPLAGLTYRRSGELTLGEWGRSLAGVREAAWFAADDLRPFLAVGARALLRRILPRRRRPGSPGVDGGATLRYVPGRRRWRNPPLRARASGPPERRSPGAAGQPGRRGGVMATLAGDRLRLTVVEDIGSLPPAGDWNLLAQLAGSPFLTAEWLTAWWGAFGNGRLTCLVLRDRQGSLRAGVCCRRLAGGRLGAAANEHTGDWDAVATDEQARKALWQAVAGLGAGAVDLAAIRSRPSRQQAAEALSAAGYRTVEVTGVRSPYLELPGTWEELLGSVSRNLRSQLGRRRRGLEREGRLRFRTSAATGEELERDLAAFFRVEASGWKFGSGTAILSDPRTTRFYTQFARAAAAVGWLRLQLLELDGVPVAADLNCRFAGGTFLIKTAYDERYAAFSPGLVLRGEVLRAAIEEGADFYDFLGGPDSYKLRWTAELRPRAAVRAYRGIWRPLGTYQARLRPLLKAGVLQARTVRAEMARRRQERRRAGSP